MKNILIKIIILLLIILFCATPVLSQEQIRLSIFLNPFKPFIGLLNIGVEYQFEAKYSFYLSAEWAGFRSRYLEKIKHPDFVTNIGIRYYVFSNKINTSGLYIGVFSGYVFTKGNDTPENSTSFLFGSELGYKIIFDNSFYIVPRGLLSYTMRSKAILPGAEVLAGKTM